MNRRNFLKIAALAATALQSDESFAQRVTGNRTRWKVRESIGFDAITFLDALSGGELYLEYYAEDASAFNARLSADTKADIGRLWLEAREGLGLLGPNLCLLLSNGNDTDIATILRALEHRDELILPAYRSSSFWSAKDWDWFDQHSARLHTIFTAMEDADFAGFRRERIGPQFGARLQQISGELAPYDVISLQEKFTGRGFDPQIEVVVLKFSKPHGIKVQGQTFLQSDDYTTAVTLKIAAHEMLHPPIAMDGRVAKAVVATLEKDDLEMRIVREHDPKWGYTTLEGLFNEDLVQALDQLISEELGVARNPADRWTRSDEGIHVLAAAFYGLLREDRWNKTGGSIEQWLDKAVDEGRLSPVTLHAAASKVLERSVDRLWPVSS